jgi:hypothetical protein
MDIAAARARYMEACLADNGKAPFEDLVGSLIETGYDKSFNNDSYFDALWLTHHMLNRTYNNFSMITGAGGDNFLSALEQPFEDALERIKSTGGKARLIILNHEKAGGLCFLNKMVAKHKGAFAFALGASTRLIRHFVVCDRKMARIEEPHEELTEASPASVIRAKVNFNDPQTAAIYDSFFSTVWERLKLSRPSSPARVK